MALVSKNVNFGGSGGTTSLQPAFSIETLTAASGDCASKENFSQQMPPPVNASQSIRIACFVDGSEIDKDAFAIARDYLKLQVVVSPNGDGYIGQDNVAFVFAEFETGSFRNLQQHRCISTQAIKVQYYRHNAKPFPKLKASRPVYCFSMVGLGFALNGFATNFVRRAVDLIHFMSGHVRRNYSADLRLIAKDTRGDYRCAVSLGHRVLTMDWLEECWKRRDDMDFVASDKNFMDQYYLKCFGGLSLCFLGFSGTELQELRDKTKENGGTVVEKLEDATHIIISQDMVDKTSRGDLQAQNAQADAHFVTLQWFWKSIHYEFCNSEDLFPAFTNELRHSRHHKTRARRVLQSPEGEVDSDRHRSGRRGMSKSELEKSNASSIPDHMFSTESLDSVASGVPPVRCDKRYHVCSEMLQTEENYFNCLELVVTLFKEPLERMVIEAENKENKDNKDRQERPILSKQEIQVIFGKIQAILNVHRVIRASLSNIMKSWDSQYDQITVGYVWAIASPELKKVYPPYVNSYDEAREMLDTCLAEIPKFHTFVKLAESDPKCKCMKITLKDMLIKPVQRLPSVVLLLNEIIKKTDKNHKDMANLKDAVTRISDVLKETNESRKQTETYSQFLSICNQIDDYPAALINSSRTFLKQIEVIGVSGDGFFTDYKGRLITLFMFNDFVAFTKNRITASLNSTMSTSIYGSTRGTLQRQMSFLPKFREKKKYRLLSMHRVPDFRLIRYDYRSEVVIVKIRVEDGDYLFVAQPCGESSFKDLVDFFALLCSMSTQLCGKETRMEELTDDVLAYMKQTASEDYQVIERAISRGSVANGGSIRRRSTLRRAVSNVSLGISSGLSKFASRAHLSFINETSL